MPVDLKCESEKVVRKVQGFGSWAKPWKDAGMQGPSCRAGMAPHGRRMAS